MKFYKQLYISNSIKKNTFQIKYSISHHPLKKSYFIICLSKTSDQLDIFNSKYLIQRYYKKHPPYIIGVAKNRQDSILLVQNIIKDIYIKTNSANVKEFFYQDSKSK
jgi:hypothetical protein